MNRKNSYLNNIISNNNKDLFILKNNHKDNKINSSNKKGGLTKDKYSSSTIINNYNYNHNSRTVLPKIKPNHRNSCNLSTKIITRPNIKKINNFKIRQESQKLYEINSKNNSNNNSMILSYEKPFYNSINNKKGKSETKISKVIPCSMPAFYPELLNSNKNENLSQNESKVKLERKNKDMFLKTIYKSNKGNAFHFEFNAKNNPKYIKLKKDNIKENNRYNKIFYKINGELDKFNLTNISLNKEKNGQIKLIMK